MVKDRPIMIIAKTIKGKGVSLLENKNGWHGKAISEDQLDLALIELGEIDKKIQGKIEEPELTEPINKKIEVKEIPLGNEKIATRKAYGNSLVNIFSKYPNMLYLMPK